MFRNVLIANRGEIAIRVMRACRQLGLGTIAIYSEADRDAPHVQYADRAHCVGPARSVESYLKIDAILEACHETGAEAVHPGYGFLSENADFAHAVTSEGLCFIGPSADAIAAMGDKTEARNLVAANGVPVLPALEQPPEDDAGLRAAADRLGFPLLVKAAAGGGGRGMRIARNVDELVQALPQAQKEAQAAFGDGRVFLERYLEFPRHVEVQILADAHGNCVHLGERECSIQRRHQKVIEECQSPTIDDVLRRRITAAAIAAARSVAYANAGTIEFLVARDGSFYFLEMNTRLQVEHPVTEWVYGLDIVQEQIRIAQGAPLWVRQEDLRPHGHAIECRLYAEDPARQYLPSAGRITNLRMPTGPGVRIDAGVREQYDVPHYYDPLLAKLSTWGMNRDEARRRMIGALDELVLEGITTNVAFLADVLRHQAFVSAELHTGFLPQHFPTWKRPDPAVAVA
jgi:acetyl-CoA carboxylase biotin carboxylase subunit